MNRLHVWALVGLMAAGSVANAQHGHGGGGHGGGHYYGGRLYYPNGYYRGGHYHPFIGIGVGIYGYGYPYYYPPLVVAPAYPYPPAPVFVQGQPQVAPVPNAPPSTATSPGDVPQPRNAQIRVILPDAQAKVWFDGNLTSSTGTERNYHTPDLAAGASNTYRIRATWMANGREVTQEQAVPVQVGRMSIADFTRPVTEGVAPPPLK